MTSNLQHRTLLTQQKIPPPSCRFKAQLLLELIQGFGLLLSAPWQQKESRIPQSGGGVTQATAGQLCDQEYRKKHRNGQPSAATNSLNMFRLNICPRVCTSQKSQLPTKIVKDVPGFDRRRLVNQGTRATPHSLQGMTRENEVARNEKQREESAVTASPRTAFRAPLLLRTTEQQ